jgi:hypothetical protein
MAYKVNITPTLKVQEFPANEKITYFAVELEDDRWIVFQVELKNKRRLMEVRMYTLTISSITSGLGIYLLIKNRKAKLEIRKRLNIKEKKFYDFGSLLSASVTWEPMSINFTLFDPLSYKFEVTML